MNKSSGFKLTPYKCKVIYMEYNDLFLRKLTLVNFILKTNLIDLGSDLRKKICIPFEEAYIINLILNMFVNIGSVFETLTDNGKNYFMGVYNLKVAQDTSSFCGEPALQHQIFMSSGLSGVGATYYYLFEMITSGRCERSELLLEAIAKEVCDHHKLYSADIVNESLSQILEKTQVIKSTLERAKEIKTLENLSNINTNLDKIKKDVDIQLDEKEDLSKLFVEWETVLTEIKLSLSKTVELNDVRISKMKTMMQKVEMQISGFKRIIESNEMLGNQIDTALEDARKILEVESHVNNSAGLTPILSHLEGLVNDISIFKQDIRGSIGDYSEVEHDLLKVRNGIQSIMIAVNKLSQAVKLDYAASIKYINDDIITLSSSIKELK